MGEAYRVFKENCVYELSDKLVIRNKGHVIEFDVIDVGYIDYYVIYFYDMVKRGIVAV